LTTNLRGNSAYEVGILSTKIAGTPLKLVLLEKSPAEDETAYHRVGPDDARLEVALTEDDGTPLASPVAMATAPTDGKTDFQRVFAVFSGTDDGARRSLVEHLVHLESVETGPKVFERGRTFEVPIRGTLRGTSFGFTPDGATLILNVPAHLGDPAQPVRLLYDIRTGSRQLQPFDIQMVPKN
jgi:hypothetical protein